MNMKAMAMRKQESEHLLTERGVPVNPHLPAIFEDGEVHLRTANDISNRIAGLLCAGGRADIASSQNNNSRYLAKVRANTGLQHASPAERAFILDDDPHERNVIAYSWVIEGVLALAWSVGWWDALDWPDSTCVVADVVRAAMNNLKSNHPIIRPSDEILDAFDLYYRFHWACVDRGIQGRSVEAGHPGVVFERRRALQWVCEPHEAWDELSLDT